MKKSRIVLLSVAGALLVVVAAAAAVFYVKVYRPIGSPLMAMAGAIIEENQRLALPLTGKLKTWAALGFFGL